jgi:hypothetical protein
MMSQPLSYTRLVDTLLDRIPAFAAERQTNESYVSRDDESPYLVFGDFGLFLLELLKSRLRSREQEQLLKDSFELLSDMATSSDDEVVNVVETTVFEQLTDSAEAVAAAEEYLSETANPVFERVEKFCFSGGG